MSRPGKKSGGGGGIPDRWLDYKAVGKRLEGTRFIAFKVPLKRSLTRRLSDSDVFGPWELLDALNQDNEELGLIIDLTFTTRYYQLQDVPASLLFVKIFTAGHEVPRDETILSFKRVVRRFLRENSDNDKLIGVHCTHGLNRTGYLICRYLIDVDGMDPKQAVDLFNSSRGHDIERKNYLEDLQCGPKRSNEGMDESEKEPQRGCAVERPCSEPVHCDDREHRREHGTDSWYHSRSVPPRGPNPCRHNHPPYGDGLLPDPPRRNGGLLPDPPRRNGRFFPDPPRGNGGLLPDPQRRNGGFFPDPPRGNGGLLPDPPFMPPPPFHPLMRARFHPYQWTPPHPGGQWRRPSPQESALMSQNRAPPPDFTKTEVEFAGHRSPWTNEDERAGHHRRYAHRVKGYDHY